MQVRLVAYNLLKKAADYGLQLKRIINETDQYQYEDKEVVSTDIEYKDRFKNILCELNHDQLKELLSELNEKFLIHEKNHVQLGLDLKVDTAHRFSTY